MKIRFSKYDAAGNDFVMIDDPEGGLSEKYSLLTPVLCNRRRGIGADGAIFLNKRSDVAFRMNYYNADGMGPAMCGNGARASVHFFCRKYSTPDNLRFLSSDGEHLARIEHSGEKIHSIAVSIREPDTIRMLPAEEDKIFLLNTGVPHLVLEKDDIEVLDVFSRGRILRQRYNANVNFISDNDGICSVRTYERGVEDETLACGTGAASVAWYLHREKNREFPITLSFKGGKLIIDKNEAGFWLKGPVTEVFTGVIDVNL